MNWWTVLIIAMLLVALDKGLTAYNIKAVQKSNPTQDAYSIEKNPAAKWFYQQLGLTWGSIIYWAISVGTFFLAILLLSFATEIWAPDNKYGTAFFGICMIYSLVLMNNFYFALRYSGLLK